MARWERFAVEVLGLQVAERAPDGALYLRMDELHYRILIESDPSDDVRCLGWEVADEAALAAVAERLRAGGYACEPGDAAACARRRVAGMVRTADPSGLANEIVWGPLVEAHRPFVSPREISGFVTGDEGIGHAVLALPDADAAMRFYRDTLGLRISDFITFERMGTPVTMAFLHCNPRHHSLAFMQLAAAPRRLSHLMLEVRDLDDVGRTFGLCEQRGEPIAMTLGRHTNDHMFSFYVVTPSGFNIEIGCGGRHVEDATWQVQRYEVASLWGHRRPAPIAPPSPAERTPS